MKKKPFPRIEPRIDSGLAAGVSAKHSQARLSPLAAAMIQSLGPAGEPAPKAQVLQAPQRKPLLSRTWMGVTVNRFADGLEIIFADGRKLAAASGWQLLRAMIQKRKA